MLPRPGVLELREAIDAGLAAAGLEGVAGGKRIGLEIDGTHGWRPFKRLASGWTILGNPPDQPTNRDNSNAQTASLGGVRPRRAQRRFAVTIYCPKV